MLSMFAFGLMNGLAMGVFAVMMFMEATLFSRAKWAKIWDVLPLRLAHYSMLKAPKP